jgi:hypothetical protein
VATLARYSVDESFKIDEKKIFVSSHTKFCAMKATVSWPRVPHAAALWAEIRRAGIVSVNFMFLRRQGNFRVRIGMEGDFER